MLRNRQFAPLIVFIKAGTPDSVRKLHQNVVMQNTTKNKLQVLLVCVRACVCVRVCVCSIACKTYVLHYVCYAACMSAGSTLKSGLEP